MRLSYRTETIRQVECLANREVLVRIVVLACVCVLAEKVLGVPAWLSWSWYAVYCTFQLFYFAVVARLPEELGLPGVTGLACLAATSLGLFLLVPAWFWAQPSDLLHVEALVLLTGAILNSLGSRSADPLLRAVDTTGILVLLFYFPAQLWWAEGGEESVVVLLFTALLLAVYFATSMTTLRATRAELHSASERELEMAHAASMGRLAGGVAHDFNNMLTAVLGNLELRREVADPAERETLIREAEAAARRAVTEIGYLTAYSRQSHLSPQLVRPTALLGALEGVARRVSGNAITVSASCPDGVPSLRADPLRLEAVLTALILNAGEAMPEGGILRLTCSPSVVRSRTQRRADGFLPAGDYVRIDVEDTGQGIPEKIRPRVTEPFFTTRSRGRHSGLGLSVAQGFAEQSGGALSIDSTLWRGTTVSIYLPAAES